MRVLEVNLGADTAGVSHGLADAFARGGPPGWQVRSMVSSTNYIDYPHDLPWNQAVLRRTWRRASVVRLQNNWLTARYLEAGWKGLPRLPRRPYVMTWHGTGFRENPEPELALLEAYGGIGLVSTLDLWLLAPDRVEWAPNPVDIERMARLRVAVPKNRAVVTVGHAPTDRVIKSTSAVIDAVERLFFETGGMVRLKLIERQSWVHCLAQKAECDVYVDQLKLGYGQSALEAWGMGTPVVAGAAPATEAEMVRRFGELPYVAATEDSLYEVLRELTSSSAARDAAGSRGRRYVETYHSYPAAVRQHSRVFLEALRGADRKSGARAGGVVRSRSDASEAS